MKTTARNTVFAVSDHAQGIPRRVSIFRSPAVSEAGVVFDMVETGVDIAELLADTLDKGADIGAISFRAVPGDEILTVDQSIDLTVANVPSCFLWQQGEDLEFRQSKVDDPSYPHRSVCVEAQREATQPQQRCTWRLWLGGRPSALGHPRAAAQPDQHGGGM